MDVAGVCLATVSDVSDLDICFTVLFNDDSPKTNFIYIGQWRVVRGECGCSLFVKSNLCTGTAKMRTATVRGAIGCGVALQACAI